MKEKWFSNMNTLSKIPFLIFTEIFYEFSPKFPTIPLKLKNPKFLASEFFAINVVVRILYRARKPI